MKSFYIWFFPDVGDPLYVGMDLTIASFDHISEVNMVSPFFMCYIRSMHALCTGSHVKSTKFESCNLS